MAPDAGRLPDYRARRRRVNMAFDMTALATSTISRPRIGPNQAFHPVRGFVSPDRLWLDQEAHRLYSSGAAIVSNRGSGDQPRKLKQRGIFARNSQ